MKNAKSLINLGWVQIHRRPLIWMAFALLVFFLLARRLSPDENVERNRASIEAALNQAHNEDYKNLIRMLCGNEIDHIASIKAIFYDHSRRFKESRLSITDIHNNFLVGHAIYVSYFDGDVENRSVEIVLNLDVSQESFCIRRIDFVYIGGFVISTKD